MRCDLESEIRDDLGAYPECALPKTPENERDAMTKRLDAIIRLLMED
jgi:hypothetical protein